MAKHDPTLEQEADAYVKTVLVTREDRSQNGLRLSDEDTLWFSRTPSLVLAKAEHADLHWALKTAFLKGALKRHDC